MDDASLAAAAATAAKRRRHRESMQRLRLNQRARIQTLGAEEEALRDELDLSIQRGNHQQFTQEQHRFVHLYRSTEALLQEQRVLEEALHWRQRYANLVTIHAGRLGDQAHAHEQGHEQEANPATTDATGRNGCWFYFQDDEPPVYFEIESPESCAAAITQCLHSMAHTSAVLAQPSADVQYAECLGWRAERLIETAQSTPPQRPMLRFRFSRLIHRNRTSLVELVNRTWAILQSPEQMARMYGSAVVSRTVQRVSDDSFILLRNSPDRAHHKRFRFFNLTTRLWAPARDSAVVLMPLLEKRPQRHNAGLLDGSDDQVVWLQHGAGCLTFTAVASEAIQLEYTGFIECADEQHVAHLLVETCVTLLRWEQLVVPPQLLPHSSGNNRSQ